MYVKLKEKTKEENTNRNETTPSNSCKILPSLDMAEFIIMKFRDSLCHAPLLISKRHYSTRCLQTVVLITRTTIHGNTEY